MPAKVYTNIHNYVVTKNINYSSAHEDGGGTTEKKRYNVRIR
jgi:hypothetical protein